MTSAAARELLRRLEALLLEQLAELALELVRVRRSSPPPSLLLSSVAFDIATGARYLFRRVRSSPTGSSSPQAAFAGIFVVTGLGLLSVGATLPVLPRYVTGPLGGGELEVGIVTGAFAITGLACRPLAGHLADRRGRKPGGRARARSRPRSPGCCYFVPAGVPGLIVARLFLGAGEGAVYTAGSAWIVDLAPPERRGRIIGLYGLAIWGGLALGPPIGELILQASSFEMVWAFAAAAPLLGALRRAADPRALRPARRPRARAAR